MKRKKIMKALADLLSRPITKLLFYLGGMALVLGLSGAFSSGKTIWGTFLNIFTSDDTLSLFFAGLVSLGLVKLLSLFDSYMEESLKIEDNHHKIINQYNAHNQYPPKLLQTIRKKCSMPNAGDGVLEDLIDAGQVGNYADKKGEFLMLRHVKDTCPQPVFPGENATKKEKRVYRRDLRKWNRSVEKKVWEKDTQSSSYDEAVKSAQRYLRGKLGLCSLNVFTNKSGKTTVRFADDPKPHELPSFVITNADELLQAHKNSAKNNSNTIRLDDFTYDAATDELRLHTSRSTYYHMLITNRCMDYQFANGMSIREVYEYDKEICPLARSKFGNQIGINGLIVTNDNYILVEKRDRKKITWKNKFAQSISLAMKVDDMKIHRWDKLGDDPSVVQNKLGEIITKTIESNFGLVPVKDYEPFEMSHNFLGLARDLLEGGKPNLYFFVRTTCGADELLDRLEHNVKVTHESNALLPENARTKVISTSKLDSDYYLIPFEDVKIDFGYCLHADRRRILRVRRKFTSRCNPFKVAWDRTATAINRAVRPILKRECGEALLVTLSYMEMCPRWRKPRKEEKNNGK
ncbi:MAG: hypothetical protein IJA74_04910 [Oscillospiraceae bacterium]|nr:hypothetical protein [Oscillospiraceae bacterium]